MKSPTLNLKSAAAPLTTSSQHANAGASSASVLEDGLSAFKSGISNLKSADAATLLLQHFESLADTLETVTKLRVLILSLAVRGRLVPQDPNDKPASLPARPAPVQKRGHQNGRNGDSQQWNAPLELPLSWQWARFDQVATIESNLVDPDEFGAAAHIAPDNIEKGTGRLLVFRTVQEDAVRSPNHRFSAGQLLYSKIRPNLAKVVLVDFDGLCSADMYPVNPHIHPPYLLYYMLSDVFLAMAVQNDTRVAMPKINQEELNRILVALPPFPEQHRIVAKVEELLALCDELEARQTTAREHRTRLVRSALDHLTTAKDDQDFRERASFILHKSPFILEDISRLRQAILSLAVQGRLVSQNANDEPASKLLKQIDIARQRLVSEKRLPASARMKIKDLPSTRLPAGWSWARFGEVTFCRDGERIPVNSDERENLAKTYDYYGASGVIDKIDRYLFDTPLLLIGEDGANLINRSTPIAFIAEGKYWVNNHAHVLDALDSTLLQYLRIYINSIDLTPYITGMAQPKMNQAQMNSIAVAVPPHAEQARIIAKVEELMRWCDQLETHLATAQTASGHLLDASLRQALNYAQSLPL